MSDPVIDADLSGYDGLDVTSGLGCQVDDDGARFHVVDNVLLDEDGRLLTGDQGRGDHYVHVFALVMEKLHLCFKELCTHGLDLFFDVWSDVESPDDGAHVLGLTHGSQTGDATTDHKNFRRRDFAGSSDLSREKPSEVV